MERWSDDQATVTLRECQPVNPSDAGGAVSEVRVLPSVSKARTADGVVTGWGVPGEVALHPCVVAGGAAELGLLPVAVVHLYFDLVDADVGRPRDAGDRLTAGSHVGTRRRHIDWEIGGAVEQHGMGARWCVGRR